MCKRVASMFVLSSLLLVTGCKAPEPSKPTPQSTSVSKDSILHVMDFYNELSDPSYRVETYLDMAIEIQKLEPEARAARLRAIAADPQIDYRTFFLCRMLLQRQDGSEFRRPFLGAPMFVDEPYGRSNDASFDKWPQEPISIYRGIPVLVTFGYVLEGRPEPPQRYLEECLQLGAWRPVTYTKKSKDEIRDILNQFIDEHRLSKDMAEWMRKQAD